MPEPSRPSDPPKVQCGTCDKEIPRTEAQTHEGQDYVLYFCGIDCFEQWRDRQPQQRGR